MLPHRISERSLSVLIDGRFRTITNQAMNFADIVELLRSGTATEDAVRELIDIPTFVNKRFFGRVSLTEDSVFFNDAQLQGYMADRILAHMRNGADVAPYANFLDNLMDHPTKDIQNDLFKWVEEGDMPFTEDGCFIAYKKVQDDYYSYRAGVNGKVYHGLGTQVSMPRSECDTNRKQTCSTGLHFCSFGYLGEYHGHSGRVIIVKVHPANVTAIPADYRNQKGRCCSYTVVGELSTDEARDVFRGRLVLRSFKEFVLNSTVINTDDAVLNEPVLVVAGAEEVPVQEKAPKKSPRPPAAVPLTKSSKTKAKKAEPKKVSKKFTHNGVEYTKKSILSLVEKLGQRGTSKKTGIPRSTLQSWIASIKGEA